MNQLYRRLIYLLIHALSTYSSTLPTAFASAMIRITINPFSTEMLNRLCSSFGSKAGASPLRLYLQFQKSYLRFKQSFDHSHKFLIPFLSYRIPADSSAVMGRRVCMATSPNSICFNSLSPTPFKANSVAVSAARRWCPLHDLTGTILRLIGSHTATEQCQSTRPWKNCAHSNPIFAVRPMLRDTSLIAARP